MALFNDDIYVSIIADSQESAKTTISNIVGLTNIVTYYSDLFKAFNFSNKGFKEKIDKCLQTFTFNIKAKMTNINTIYSQLRNNQSLTIEIPPILELENSLKYLKYIN